MATIEVNGFKFDSLFCDQYGDPYASFTWCGKLIVALIKSRKFRGYLRDCAYEEVGEVLTERAIEALVEHFSALAYLNKDPRTLHLRVARDSGGDILIDGIPICQDRCRL
jgi:hypothetical protein